MLRLMKLLDEPLGSEAVCSTCEAASEAAHAAKT